MTQKYDNRFHKDKNNEQKTKKMTKIFCWYFKMHYVCTEKREGGKLIAKIVVKMIQKLHFVKMHGAGNDYIYVDAMEYDMDDPAAVARMVSDRHKGIGSDGLVLIGRAEDLDRDRADFTIRIFNADGSEARMCGNACRCV